jgi:hypothetical protein
MYLMHGYGNAWLSMYFSTPVIISNVLTLQGPAVITVYVSSGLIIVYVSSGLIINNCIMHTTCLYWFRVSLA